VTLIGEFAAYREIASGELAIVPIDHPLFLGVPARVLVKSDRPGSPLRMSCLTGSCAGCKCLRGTPVQIPDISQSIYPFLPFPLNPVQASDFLTKPFRDKDMLDTVAAALKRDCELRSQERLFANIQICYETLTPREKEVVSFVVERLMNKQIADRMGLSEVTVKIHCS
jgi:hypothetical protein